MKEIKYVEDEIQQWEDGKMQESFFSKNPETMRDMLDSWWTQEIEGDAQHHGPVFDVITTWMELPSGKSVQREIVKNKNVVCVVPVDISGNILFVRQMRPISKFLMLELPAGHIEEGENPKDAAIREMGEETGFEPTNVTKIGSFLTSPGWCTEFTYSFLVTGLTESALVPDEDEEIELVRVPAYDIMNMIKRGEIIDSKVIASLLLALPLLKRGSE